MKQAMAMVLIMVVASVGIQSAAEVKSDSGNSFSVDGPSFHPTGSGIKKLEERISEALASIPSAPGKEKGEDSGGNRSAEAVIPTNSSFNPLPLDSSSIVARAMQNASQNQSNSSLNETSFNETRSNAISLDEIGLNRSADNSTSAREQDGTDDAIPSAAATSANRFKGFYSTKATRHEIGKERIESSMFLSGEFEMEKSVKFQDRGF